MTEGSSQCFYQQSIFHHMIYPSSVVFHGCRTLCAFCGRTMSSKDSVRALFLKALRRTPPSPISQDPRQASKNSQAHVPRAPRRRHCQAGCYQEVGGRLDLCCATGAACSHARARGIRPAVPGPNKRVQQLLLRCAAGRGRRRLTGACDARVHCQKRASILEDGRGRGAHRKAAQAPG